MASSITILPMLELPLSDELNEYQSYQYYFGFWVEAFDCTTMNSMAFPFTLKFWVG